MYKEKSRSFAILPGMKTPVAFIIFNRPDTTNRVFEEIVKAKPSTLLIVADGPRTDKPGDIEKCSAARAVVEKIDWDCEVLRNYSDVNLGCKRRVSSGLDWVFDNVEEAAILEDDCLPDQSFFIFCSEMLDRFRNSKNIMHISGTNLLAGHPMKNSYLFSRYGGIWGWATWKRAWRYYDESMLAWEKLRDNSRWLELVCETSEEVKSRIETFNKVFGNEFDTWDYQWICKTLGWLKYNSKNNLIENIGFREDATHTHVVNDLFMVKKEPLNIPFLHETSIARNLEFDSLYARKYFGKESKVNMLLNRIKFRKV
jgi:hypothetical protein